MPDIPLIIPAPSSCSRWIDQMHNEYFRAHMSEEENIAAEESLYEAYEPTKLYDILQQRAIKNPLFLQRNLNYQIEAKHQRRIQMTLFIPSSKDAAGRQTQKIYPLIIMLARLVSSKPTAEHSVIYKQSRACVLTGIESQPQAKFLLPRMDRLLAMDAKLGSLAILIFSFEWAQNSQFGIDSSKIPSDSIGGHCLWSKIPLESLYSSWEKYPNMDLGQKAHSVSLVEMQPCFLQVKCMSKEKSVMIQVPSNPLTSSSPQQMKVTISAEEVGPTEKSPYSYLFPCNDIPSSSMLKMIRVREGNVIFNYRYYNNKLQETEVTEDFTCPFCLVKCSSFKGLQCHMPSTHDLFNFQFWVNEKYQTVNVSLKSETMITEITEDDLNARREPYFFSSKKSSRRKQKNPARNSRQGPHKTEENIGSRRRNQKNPVRIPRQGPHKTEDNIGSRRKKQKNPVRVPRQGPHKAVDADSVKSKKSQIPPGAVESSSQIVPPIMSPGDLQMMHISKKSSRRKQKTPVRYSRQGPHKTDDIDSTKSEKSQIPHRGAESSCQKNLPGMCHADLKMKNMWNSFERKHRVCADGRIPWGCEEFSKLYGPFMVRNPHYLWCWKKFIWTLWSRGLLDCRTLNKCMVFLE